MKKTSFRVVLLSLTVISALVLPLLAGCAAKPVSGTADGYVEAAPDAGPAKKGKKAGVSGDL